MTDNGLFRLFTKPSQMGASNMEREKILSLIKEVLNRDGRTIFAYAYGSFVKEESFRDIDIGIYIKNPEEIIFVVTSDLRTEGYL
jgi:predicted nucleotidyltransferase